MTIVGNEVSDNNTRGDALDNDASGIKAVSPGTILKVLNNYFHNNHAVAMWMDIGVVGAIVQGNTVINNDYNGIMFEISNGADISHNVVNNNGLCSSPFGFQIYASSSSNADVHDNNVTVGPSCGQAGLIMLNQDRVPTDGFSGNTQHNNTVTFQGSAGLSGFYAICTPGTGNCATPSGNSTTSNFYNVTSLTDAHWVWPNPQTVANAFSGLTWSTYRSTTGQDTAPPSTLTVGSASVAGCTHIGCTGSGW